MRESVVVAAFAAVVIVSPASAQKVPVNRQVLILPQLEVATATPQFVASVRSIPDAATVLIRDMHAVCVLTEAQRRTLTIASKGVAHRLREKYPPHREPPRNVRMLGFRGGKLRRIAPVDYVAPLKAHRIWTNAVARVLTDRQKRAWGARRSASQPASGTGGQAKTDPPSEDTPVDG